MRIIFLANYGFYKYGSNLSLINLLDGLKDKDVDPLVIIPKKGSLEKELIIRNIPVFNLPFSWWVSSKPSRINTIKNLINNIKCAPNLVQIIRKFNCNLVYSNNVVFPTGAMIASITRLPHIWHIREFVDLDWDLDFEWGKFISKLFIRKATSRISVSKSIQSYYWGNNPPKRSFVIYNGIAFYHDFVRLYKKNKDQVKNSKQYKFALVGTIYPKKGQVNAIHAFSHVVKRNKDVRLLIVGDGEINFIDYCKNLAERLGISNRVEFTGYVDDPYSLQG